MGDSSIGLEQVCAPLGFFVQIWGECEIRFDSGGETQKYEEVFGIFGEVLVEGAGIIFKEIGGCGEG